MSNTNGGQASSIAAIFMATKQSSEQYCSYIHGHKIVKRAVLQLYSWPQNSQASSIAAIFMATKQLQPLNIVGKTGGINLVKSICNTLSTVIRYVPFNTASVM